MYHYRDLLNDDESWQGLLIEGQWFADHRLEVCSSPNYRIKVLLDGEPILWASASRDYWGIWILPSNDFWTRAKKLLPPIRSNEVLEDESEAVYYRRWARYFVTNLYEQRDVGEAKTATQWQLSKGYVRSTKHSNRYNLLADVASAFNTESPIWIPWGIGGSGSVVAIRAINENDTGRIKWYRKLVRQQLCPPVLVWYLSAIDSYLVIDGHCRFQAYLLEEELPNFLILSERINIKVDPEAKRPMQESVLRAIKQRKHHRYKSALDVDSVNNLLISTYDDRPIPRMITRAKFSDNEQLWMEEVELECAKIDCDPENLDMMLRRESL